MACRANSGNKKSMWDDVAKPPKFSGEDVRDDSETIPRAQVGGGREQEGGGDDDRQLAERNRDGTGELDMLDQAYDQKSRKFPIHTRQASVATIPEEEPVVRQVLGISWEGSPLTSVKTVQEDARDRKKQEYAMELQAQML
eukprot:762855-Hanusia_phi.AAC.5